MEIAQFVCFWGRGHFMGGVLDMLGGFGLIAWIGQLWIGAFPGGGRISAVGLSWGVGIECATWICWVGG